MCNFAAATSISTLVSSGWFCSSSSGGGSDVTPAEEVCSWVGVSCDADRQVIDIDLSVLTGITGSLSNSLRFLQSLGSLRLGQNSVTNIIPTGLGLLSRLTNLNVSYNQLTGPLPAELANTHLKRLIANNNYLTGSIPSGLCLNSNLTYLSLDANDLSCYASCLSSMTFLSISSSLRSCTSGEPHITVDSQIDSQK